MMRKDVIQKLVNFVNSYNSKKMTEAEKIKNDFIRTAKILEADVDDSDFYGIINGIGKSCWSVEDMVRDLLNRKGNKVINKLVKEYPICAGVFKGFHPDEIESIEISRNTIKLSYDVAGAPAFLLIDIHTGEKHSYNYEADSVEYNKAINNFRKEDIVSSFNWKDINPEEEIKDKEEIIMAQENNATINTTNNKRGENVMTKDMLREELKKHGIEMSNVQFKKTKHERLVEMLGEAIQAQVPEHEIDKAKVGAFEDKTPVILPVDAPVGFDFDIKTVDAGHLQSICHNIWLRSYECTKSLSEENIGKRMIKKNALYRAIYDAYKKEIGKAEVPDKFYQRISWSLEHCGYISIKKYDTNAFAIFVEDKCKGSVKVTTNTVAKIDITFHNADVQTDGVVSINKDYTTVHHGTYCIAMLKNNTHDIRVTVTNEADTAKVNALVDALLA